MIIETKHNQTTISKEVSLKGVGLHTGKVDLTFSPSEANTGYIFKRTDLDGQPTIKADIGYVSSTDREPALKMIMSLSKLVNMF